MTTQRGGGGGEVSVARERSDRIFIGTRTINRTAAATGYSQSTREVKDAPLLGSRRRCFLPESRTGADDPLGRACRCSFVAAYEAALDEISARVYTRDLR